MIYAPEESIRSAILRVTTRTFPTETLETREMLGKLVGREFLGEIISSEISLSVFAGDMRRVLRFCDCFKQSIAWLYEKGGYGLGKYRMRTLYGT